MSNPIRRDCGMALFLLMAQLLRRRTKGTPDPASFICCRFHSRIVILGPGQAPFTTSGMSVGVNSYRYEEWIFGSNTPKADCRPVRVVTGQIRTFVSAKYLGTRSDSQLGTSWLSFRYASTAALIFSRFLVQATASTRSVEGL